jgi:CHAT domain-containing protein
MNFFSGLRYLVESCLLALPITGFSYLLMKKSDSYGGIALNILCVSCAIFFAFQVIQNSWRNKSQFVENLFKRLNINLLIICIVSVLIVFVDIVIFLLSSNSFFSIWYMFSINLLLPVWQNFNLVNLLFALLGLGLTAVVPLILTLLLLIVHVVLYTVDNYCFTIQPFSEKYPTKLTSINFIIAKITSTLLSLCFLMSGLSFLSIVIGAGIGSFVFYFNIGNSSTFEEIILGIFFTYISINYLAFLLLLTLISFGFLIATVKINTQNNSFQENVYNIIYVYVKTLKMVTKYLIPYTLLGLFSKVFYFTLAQLFLDNFNLSELSFASYESRKFMADIVYQLIDEGKPSFFYKLPLFKRYYLSQQIRIMTKVAYQMFLLGDLKRADSIYKKAWASVLTEQNNIPKEVNLVFNQVFDYYLKTSQYDPLNLLLKDSWNLANQKKLLKLTYLANLMKGEFAMGSYALKDIKNFSAWKSLLGRHSCLYLLAEIIKSSGYSYNTMSIKEPIDFYKMYFTSLDEESARLLRDVNTGNQYYQPFIQLSNEIGSFFETQDKIYTFLSTQSSDFLPTEKKLIINIKPFLDFNILGIDIRFENPFYQDNIKLIPLIYLASEYSSSLTILDILIEGSEYRGRKLDLAFLKCCKGNLFIRQNDFDEGLSILQEGIDLYEGIRYGITTDQLGIGLGSNYLEYYDWAINALIGKGDYQTVFEYVERSTARALLDLASRKTYRPDSVGSNPELYDIIGKIQEIDYRIYFSKDNVYKQPFYARFLSANFKKKLEKNYYKEQTETLNSILKERIALVKALTALDPLSATLVELTPLVWKNANQSQENTFSFEDLWQDQCIAESEAVICFHVTHQLSSIGNNKIWNKIIGFVVYRQNDQLKLYHHVIEDSETVLEIQQLCLGLYKEVKNTKRLKSLILISENLTIPLLNNLPNTCKAITITANSDLHFIPWSILYDENNNFLIEKFKIKIAPSLSFLYLLKKREIFSYNQIPETFLVAGLENYPDDSNYLFWSGVEVRRIAEVYENVSVLKDEQVDQLFTEQFKKAEVIHYSGHGQYDQSNSGKNILDKTYLALYNTKISAAQILDGALTNPDAKAMILSACLTGRGDLTASGSEILGLERALFHAGLSALITTLWSVSDFSTALLMIKLHQTWQQYNNDLEYLAYSLQEAQLWLKDLTWKQLKSEFPEIENDVENCLTRYQQIIDNTKNREDKRVTQKLEGGAKYYQQVAQLLQLENTSKPFSHPYYWAAFQVKGLG